MCHKIVAQTFYWEIGIHNTHKHTYEKQQKKYLYRIVKEKINCRTKLRISTKTENTVHQPICKILYHNNEENKIRNKTNIKNINNGGKVSSAYFRRI